MQHANIDCLFQLVNWVENGDPQTASIIMLQYFNVLCGILQDCWVPINI